MAVAAAASTDRQPVKGPRGEIDRQLNENVHQGNKSHLIDLFDYRSFSSGVLFFFHSPIPIVHHTERKITRRGRSESQDTFHPVAVLHKVTPGEMIQ